MKKAILPIVILLTLISCYNKSETNPVNFIDFESIINDSKFKDHNIKDSLNTLDVKNPTIILDSIKYHVVEGDLLFNEYEFMQYQIYKSIDTDSTKIEPKLVGEIRNNRIVKWDEDQVLNYSISKKSFRTNEEYEFVKTNLNLATKEWEKTCNVKFYHNEFLDNSDIINPTANLTFVVLGYDSKGVFIASAFFPYYPKNRRKVLIDPTYFTTTFDKVGVLRHELGHTLGFRHEHIRSDAPLACQGESTTGTIDLTQYDPKSVMHYFCGGMGNIKLEITEVDKIGAQSIYGQPKNN